jgi:hypothetical protein
MLRMDKNRYTVKLGVAIFVRVHYRLIKFVYRLHIETVLSLFFYNKTLLYLLIALWLSLEFLHIKEINKEKPDICFIKGRYIGDNIRSLLEVIDLAEEENLSCIVLSIDFEKAFDTISWNFLSAY